jgi:transposase
MSKSEIGKLFEHCLACLRKTRIPLFSCKFSKRTYTQHQHLSLLVLKTYLNLGYRETSDLAHELWITVSLFGLEKVPHFTTLQKFFERIPNWWLEILLNRVLHHYNSIKYLAIDSTGLAAGRTSRYFQMRMGRKVLSSNFLKMSILLDVKRRLPVAVCCHNRQRHDNRDLLPLLNKIDKPVEYFLADKAYDSEGAFAAIKARSIKPIIPVRIGSLMVYGRLRNEMIDKWATHPTVEKQYHQRSLVESFFSAVKRRFGEEVKSRLWNLQRREAMLKVLVYSMSRSASSAALIEVFYRAASATCAHHRLLGFPPIFFHVPEAASIA